MSNPFDLSGKTVLVTGASSGIGRQCCAAIAGQGGTVVASGRSAERLAETVGSLAGTGHRVLPADLANAEEISALARLLPPLDGFVHSAGAQQYLPLKFFTERAIHEMLRVNYEAPLLLAQQLCKLKLLRAGGALVFISSLGALNAVRGNALYSGAKAALLSAARVLALELAGQQTRVNCVAPGMVRTRMAEQMAAAVSAEQMAEHEKLYPLGFGRPEDVAGVVVFLLSPASRWVTGQTVIADGGFSCQ